MPARAKKASQVTQIQIVGSVIDEGIHREDRVKELSGKGQRARIGLDRKNMTFHLGVSDSPQFSEALNQRSVAQTSTPNSRCRKIDDEALPQPRSSTRIPGRRSIAVVNHSANHNELAPPLALATTHSG